MLAMSSALPREASAPAAEHDAASATAAPWNINALPQPQASSDVDIGAIVRGFDTQARAAGQRLLDRPPALLVFVSFAMPEPSLRLLVAQAARVRARVLLRGLAGGSLQETVRRAQGVVGKQGALSVNPDAFERFDVKSVPTFVLLHAGPSPEGCMGQACVPVDDFIAVSGDVSLDHALAHLTAQAPAFAELANALRARLAQTESKR
jgi:conjugal transfer pilus assembly protein TrbC